MCKKKLSIIIPMYNSENDIEDLLTSIVQGNSENIEVIVVDDGSTDDSFKKAISYSKKDNRIKVYQQKNAGAPAARNNGLKHSEGEYIYIVDSDDRLFSSAISRIIKYLDESSPDLLIGSYSVFSEDNKLIESNKFENKIITTASNNFNEVFFLSPLPGNKIFKKAVIAENNLKYTNVKIGQDLNFFIKFIPFAKNILFINENIYKYYVRENSISRTYSRKILDISTSINDAEAFYRSNDFSYPEIIEKLKVMNYYLQLSKVPFIKDKKERKYVSNEFRKIYQEVLPLKYKNNISKKILFLTYLKLKSFNIIY